MRMHIHIHDILHEDNGSFRCHCFFHLRCVSLGVAEGDPIPPLYFGDNTTQPNGGSLVTSARQYNRFRWNSTVAQQSWSYADFSDGSGPFPHVRAIVFLHCMSRIIPP